MDIEFICTDKLIAEHFPPVPAKKAIPEWYKNIPYYINGKPPTAREMVEGGMGATSLTVKGCIPFLDFLTSGYVLRYPADIAITSQPVVNNGRDWYWHTRYSQGFVGCGTHSNEQCPIEIDGVKNSYIKILNPWVIKTPPGYSCFFYQPLDFESPVQLFSGVVDTDNHESPIHFPGFVKKEGEFVLKGGDPLMVVFPFKRDEWKMKARHEELKDPKFAVWLFLERGYKKLFHKQKQYD